MKETGDEPRWLEDSEKDQHRLLRQSLDEAPHWAHSEVRQRRLWTRVADPANSARATRKAFRTGALIASALTVLVASAIELVRFRVSADDVPTPVVAAAPAAPVVAAAPVAAAPAPAPNVAKVDGPTQPSEVIETGPGERRTRQLRQNARADVLASSVLVVDETGRPSVRKGQVRFQVAHQTPGQRFSVRFGGYVAVVVGTRFVVSVHDTKAGLALGLTVEEGTVEIWRGDSHVARVTHGQAWSNADPAAVTPVTRVRATTSVSASVTSVEPELIAARAETDPRRALALYAALAEGQGPSAENALYEMAAIYQDKLGQPLSALATWERYRTRFPGGLLRTETDLSIVDALASLGENARALSEAVAFLKRYPRTERRGEVARVAGDLSRSRGDCPSAVGFYAMVLNGRSEADDADDAAFGHAACLLKQGDAAADQALRGYLTRHPTGRHVIEARNLASAAASATSTATSP
ncbi:MAG: hypothetical protein QOI66_2894 [Myxococcales bacterium]|jgi:hypothetical protein|nr:hypothetical protein [Myxococcales bacterium]